MYELCEDVGRTLLESIDHLCNVPCCFMRAKGWNAVMYAAFDGRAEVVKQLLAEGANKAPAFEDSCVVEMKN